MVPRTNNIQGQGDSIFRNNHNINKSHISDNSDSAFEVIDYGYDSHKSPNRNTKDSYVFPSGSKRVQVVNANISNIYKQPLSTIKEQNYSK
jgi:hypothetical protein